MKDIMNVTYVSRFDFTDDKGKRLMGTKIIYEGRNLKEETKKGVEAVIMTSQNYSDFEKFPVVPSKYEIEFLITPTSKGTKMEFVNALLIK
jgi:hypothetical protein